MCHACIYVYVHIYVISNCCMSQWSRTATTTIFWIMRSQYNPKTTNNAFHCVRSNFCGLKTSLLQLLSWWRNSLSEETRSFYSTMRFIIGTEEYFYHNSYSMKSSFCSHSNDDKFKTLKIHNTCTDVLRKYMRRIDGLEWNYTWYVLSVGCELHLNSG